MISVIVLTHNDEKIIEKCLKSISWCDEVIVVDDNSPDKTRDIAKMAGAKVFEHPLDDDFANQRNFGLSKARGDWVLFVDSDELVTEELRIEIKQKLDSRLRGNDLASLRLRGARENVGYYIKRKDRMWGRWLKHGETSDVKLLRLAKKGSGIWMRPVHEVWNVHGPVSELKNSLHHYPHPNVAQFLDEINFYSTLQAKYLSSKGVNAHWWHIIAYPKAKFLVNYIWRLGFLDGTAGMVMALMMSFHSFLVRSKLWVLSHDKHI